MNLLTKKLFLLFVSLLSSFSIYAYDFEVDGFYYEVNLEEMTATLVAGDNPYSGAGAITIPETVEYKNRLFSVIGIDGAFKNCPTLETVSIPQSIIFLGKESFYGCTSLNTIINASGVLEIDDYCFYNCSSISELPNFKNLNSIGSYAFSNCKKLESITFNNDKLNIIGEYAFSNCDKLTKISIPDKILFLSSGIFSGCRSITEINLPPYLQSIDESAFCNCSSITSIIIPPSVNKIGNDCFTGCTSLSELIIKDSSTSLDMGTKGSNSPLFEDCPLCYITIGRNLTYPIDTSNLLNEYYSPFFKNPNIKEVIFGKGITTLNYKLFYGCIGINQISFPSNIKTIHNGVFCKCTNISTVRFEDSFSDIFFDTDDFVNPYGIGYIFMNDCNITNLYLGRSVLTAGKTSSSIGFSAFYHQTNIEKIEIGDFVSDIDCLLYTENGTVGSSLNRFSKLKDFKVGASLTFVPDLSTNTNLVQLSLSATTPPNASVFSNSQYINLIPNIPVGSLEAYKSANIWKNFWDFNEEENLFTCFDYEGLKYHIIGDKKVEIIKKSSVYSGEIIIPKIAINNSTNYSIESINEGAFTNSNIISVDIQNSSLILPSNVFSGCDKLQTVNLINGITEIPSGCFSNCSSLSIINIPTTITSIGEASFKGCVSLDGFDCPHSLLFLGNEAFANCTSLREFQINESLKSLGSSVFSGCNTLEEFTFNSKIIIIPSNTFNGCSSLTYLNNTNGITYIETAAFDGCEKLTSYNFPSVISISDNAFQNCTSLNKITFGNSLTSIGQNAFYGCSNIESLSIPSSVIDFGTSAFKYCEGLKELTFEDGDNPLILNGAYDTSTSIRSTFVNNEEVLYMIYYYEPYFSGLPIEKLHLGRNLSKDSRYTIRSKSYTSGAVEEDYYLITSYDGPFGNLSELKELTIGENVDILGPEQEYIPEVDLYVTPGSFKNCSSIESVDVKNPTPPSGAEFPTTVYNSAKLYVPDNTYSLYSCADGWKEFVNIKMIIVPNAIVLDKETITINIGDVYKISATVYPENTTDKTITWVSSDDSVVKVSYLGEVTGVSEGKATITASCGNVSVSCEVEVIATNGIEDILVNPDEELHVYNPQGVLVADGIKLKNLKQLASGYYIVVSQSKKWKIKI